MVRRMTAPIRRVAVLGAGVMGSGIAAHCANAGIPVVLLDIVPPKGGPRNSFADGALEKLKKAKPAAFTHSRNAILIQTGNLEDFPVVLVGREYWEHGIAQIRKFVAEKTIDQVDLDKLMITDDPNEAVKYVTDIAMKKFGLGYGKQMRKRWWLGDCGCWR